MADTKPLSRVSIISPNVSANPFSFFAKNAESAANASSRVLLVGYCHKTLGLGDENGRDEICLYFNLIDETYRLDTYRKFGNNDEIHHSYPASQKIYQTIMNKIETLNLKNYEGKKGYGLNGSEFVCKFKSGDCWIRISSNNMGSDGPRILASIGSLMQCFIDENK